METIFNISLTIFLALFAALVLAVFMSLPLWFLWNWLVPPIFGLAEITIVQAFGLNFLFAMIFKTSVTTNK